MIPVFIGAARSAALGTVAFAVALTGCPAFAQAAPGFAEAVVTKLGTPSTPFTGNGTVVVQVLVHTDGSFKVMKLVRSSNSGDDKAALEIAQNSTYKPAMSQGRPVESYKDFTIKFEGKTASLSGGEPVATGIAAMETKLHKGDYPGAKADATAYLAQHPDDSGAQLVLGAADAFLNDDEGATAAFDKVPSISPRYSSLASHAYADYAITLVNSKNYDAAITAARRASMVDPTSPNAAYALGVAQVGAGKYAEAATSLQQAQANVLKDPAASVALKSAILVNLGAAYAGQGSLDKAAAQLAAAKALDPKANGDPITVVVVAQAGALEKAGKNKEAAALYDRAASYSPNSAVDLYTGAASAMLNAQTPDPTAATAYARKALALSPDAAGANFALAVAMIDQGRAKEALPILDRALASAKASNDTQLANNISDMIQRINKKQ